MIAKGKTPVAKLVPVTPRPVARRIGAMKGKASTGDAFFEDLPDAELAAWES